MCAYRTRGQVRLGGRQLINLPESKERAKTFNKNGFIYKDGIACIIICFDCYGSMLWRKVSAMNKCLRASKLCSIFGRDFISIKSDYYLFMGVFLVGAAVAVVVAADGSEAHMGMGQGMQR